MARLTISRSDLLKGTGMLIRAFCLQEAQDMLQNHSVGSKLRSWCLLSSDRFQAHFNEGNCRKGASRVRCRY